MFLAVETIVLKYVRHIEVTEHVLTIRNLSKSEILLLFLMFVRSILILTFLTIDFLPLVGYTASVLLARVMQALQIISYVSSPLIMVRWLLAAIKGENQDVTGRRSVPASIAVAMYEGGKGGGARDTMNTISDPAMDSYAPNKAPRGTITAEDIVDDPAIDSYGSQTVGRVTDEKG